MTVAPAPALPAAGRPQRSVSRRIDVESPADELDPLPPPVRRLHFEWPDDLDPDWTPLAPELASVANAVSLLMPHAEPYVVTSVRSVLADLEGPLAEEAAAWIGQETAHHGSHHRFNRLLIDRRPGLARVDRWAATTFRWLGRRTTRFGLAYAAGFETLAFTVARWVDGRAADLFRGADPVPTTLFLWHLAEEVEHKTVAFDVHRARGGGRLSLATGMVAALLVTAWFTLLGTLVGMAGSRRIWRPSAHLQMAAWTFGFTFDLLPALAASLVAGHHPTSLADPAWLPVWLRSYDPATRTMPEWSLSVTER